MGAPISWSRGRQIDALLDERGVMPPAQLTLGVLTTREAWADVIVLCRHMAPHVTEIVIALDAVAPDKMLEQELREAVAPPVHVITHPLGGDFAAQRNRVQAAASAPWVLQLDTDERLTQSALQQLPSLLEEASHFAWYAIALPRRNIVDGMISALYPDVQYRLLRRTIQFTRPVHEYPVLTGYSSFVALGTDILHSIEGRRLAKRERAYEAIAAGAGRPDDTALLRQPLDEAIRLLP
jgi:hypothetical protein